MSQKHNVSPFLIDEKNKLTKFAEENDLTISQIIRRSVKMFLDSQEAKDEE